MIIKPHAVLAVTLLSCLVAYATGSKPAWEQQMVTVIGGLPDCNMPDGYEYDYKKCTGAPSADCGQYEWRVEVKVPPFGKLTELYETEEYCREQNDRCDSQDSFEWQGDDPDACVRAIPVFY